MRGCVSQWVFVGLLCIGRVAWAQNAVTIVTKTGDPAPSAGTTFGAYMDNPAINELGQVVFRTQFPSSGADAIYTGTPGTLSLVAMEGGAAPGLGAATFLTINRAAFNDQGQVAFYAVLNNVASGAQRSVWAGSAGSLSLVAQSGAKPPGAPDGTSYELLYDPVLSNNGQIAFKATVTGGAGSYADGFAVFSGPLASVGLLAGGGLDAPGTAAGTKFMSAFEDPVINDSGVVAFNAGLMGGGVTPMNDGGIWRGTPGAVSLVVRDGQQAPTRPAGVTLLVAIGSTQQPVINNAGQIVFNASVSAATSENGNPGVWSEGSGTLLPTARGQTPVPGVEAGTTFAGLDYPVINKVGKVSFFGYLSGAGIDPSNNAGVWSEGTGALALVARKGAQAPDAPIGALFASFGTNRGGTVMNDAGQVAFAARLSGTGVTSSNAYGIWAVDPFNRLVKIIRDGDPVTVAPGNVRTLGAMAAYSNAFPVFSGGEDGRPSTFNDRGQLVFAANFVPGSGAAIMRFLVGGPVRLVEVNPVFGPAVANGYGVGSPIVVPGTGGAHDWVVVNTLPAADNNAGFVDFTGFGAGEQVDIMLKIATTTTTVPQLRAYLQDYFGGAATVSDSDPRLSFGAGYDLLITYPSAISGIEQTFYWNFADHRDVGVTSIAIAPEPGSLLGLLGLLTLAVRRRRRKVGSG